MPRFIGTTGPDDLHGGSDNDVMFGYEGDDTLAGGGGPDTIIGGDGLDSLIGGPGDDLIFTGDGKGVLGSPMKDTEPGDSVDGGAGNDTIVAGAGDIIDGGIGDNVVIIDFSADVGGVGGDLSPLDSGGTATLSDGTQLSRVHGGQMVLGRGADFMQFDNQDWAVHGHGGDDDLGGGDGADTFEGGGGADSLEGGQGADVLAGSQFQDDGSFNRYSAEHNSVDGGAGNDQIFGSATDTLLGGTGKDSFVLDLSGATAGITQDIEGFRMDNGADLADGGHIGQMESGLIRLGSGDDTIGGVGWFALTLSGGTGVDTLELDCTRYRVNIGCDLRELKNGTVDIGIVGVQIAGFERLSSVLMGGGDDTITTSASQLQDQAMVSGGLGKDLLSVIGGSADGASIDGGGGDDTISVNGKLFNGQVDGGSGADSLSVAAGINVGVRLMGGIGDDSVTGGNGADTVDGGLGNDHLEGGGGIDTVDYGFATSGVNINLGAAGGGGKPKGGQTTGGGGKDTCSGIENVELSDSNDHAWGSNVANAIDGRAGLDQIDGGGGDDTLTGGLGADILTGGSGADHFVYAAVADSAAGAPDLIRDFALDDVLDLHLIDADTGHAGNQAFTRVASFTGHAGEMTVVFDHATRLTSVSLDVDGDGAADGLIHLAGRVTDPGFVFVV